MRLMLLMICGALRIGSLGNITLSSVWFFRPVRRTVSSNVRLIAIKPPMPVKANPKPSWIGVNPSTKMMATSENPLRRSGSRVVKTPMAFTDILSAISSCRIPLYSSLSDRSSGSLRPRLLAHQLTTLRPLAV